MLDDVRVAVGKVRQRVERAQTPLRHVLRPELRLGAVPVSTFWWNGRRNFGDVISAGLFPEFGVAPLWSEPGDARLFAVGSIIHFIPDSFDGAVFGSGLMQADSPPDLSQARIHALRGHLTVEGLSLVGDVALGDPGLLAAPAPRVRATGRIAVVPHYVHRSGDAIRTVVAEIGAAAEVVDVRRSPRAVVNAIASCDYVVSTSLHGVIVADALGIPALWALPEPVIGGADFKFRDHESVVLPSGGRRVELEDIRSADDVRRWAKAADADRVANAQRDLRAAGWRLREELGDSIPRWKLLLPQR